MHVKVFLAICFLVLCSFSEPMQFSPIPSENIEISFIELGKIDTIGQARGVLIKNDIAFVTDMGTNRDTTGGLYIFNVSDPTNPRQLSHFYDGGRSHQLAFYNDSILLIGDNSDGLEFFDVSNLSNPIKIADFSNANYLNDFVILNNTVLASSFTEGLIVIDITNISHPSEQARFFLSNIQPIAIQDDFAFVSGLGGLYILDIANLTDIKQLKKYDYEVSDFVLSDSTAYVACSGSILSTAQGFKIFNISDPLNLTEIGSFYDGGHPIGLTLQNNYIFIADYDNGIEILDISKSPIITKVASFNEGGNAFDLQVVGDLLYVADGSEGLKILQIKYTVKAPSTTYQSISISDSSETKTSSGFLSLVILITLLSLVKLKRKLK